MKSKKKIYFEWIRIIACGLVIFNHLDGFSLYMISSGALLLRKSEDFITVIKKRASRFCLVILVFEFGFYVEYICIAIKNGYGIEGFTLSRFVLEMLSGSIEGTEAYWYLYSYLGLLLMLPFLQRIVKDVKRQDVYVLMFLRFIVLSLLPILNLCLRLLGNEGISLSESLELPFAISRPFFYSLIGYYMEFHVDVKSLSKKKVGMLIAATGIGICISCLCTFCEGKFVGTYTQNYIQLFDYLIAIAVFLLIKYIVLVIVPESSDGKFAGTIRLVGSLTFGIYLLDPYLKWLFCNQYQAFAEPYLPTVFVSIGWCVVSMMLGGVLTYVLKKLPIFRKIL